MRDLTRALERLRRCILAWVILLGLTVAPIGLEAQSGNNRQEKQEAAAKVWVNTGSGVYHCPRTRWYGNTRSGKYLNETEARGQGYRPAYGRVCGPVAAGPDSVSVRALSTALPAPGMVWVNTNSGVYHCPGTRYHGATKHGKYMTESDARAAGNRPAYGRTCS